MSRVLSYLDAPIWRLVRELYLKDKVVEALEQAETLGGLDTNELYAEAEVRELGTAHTLRPWLSLELIESEVGDSLVAIRELVARECEGISAGLAGIIESRL